MDEVIYSFDMPGIPIGNYTSQWFSNIYLFEFDHKIKEVHKIKYYMRYMDDMLMFFKTKQKCFVMLKKINEELSVYGLKLNRKSQIGDIDLRPIDFCGYVHYRDHSLVRKSTKVRMKKKVKTLKTYERYTLNDLSSVCSYEGVFQHCNGLHLTDVYITPVKEAYYANYQ